MNKKSVFYGVITIVVTVLITIFICASVGNRYVCGGLYMAVGAGALAEMLLRH